MPKFTDVFPFREIDAYGILVDSEIYDEKLVLTETLPAGKYMLTLTMAYSSPDTNDSFYFKRTRDIADPFEYLMESKDATDVRPVTISMSYDHPGGDLDIGIEMRKEDVDANNITIHAAAIYAQRVA